MKYLLLAILSLSFFKISSQTDDLKITPYLFENQSGEKLKTELGVFSVLEDRNNPSSRHLKLHFVRFKSTNANPGNPIVYLAGGPGGSGINAARGRRFEIFKKLTKIADVIAFDQRGTGMSNKIPKCHMQAKFEVGTPGTSEIYLSKISDATLKCIDFWKKGGVAIEGYNTVENSNDLEALREALGVEKIDLWGISYGSHLALDFLKRYEKSVGKVVLAGLEGLDQTVKRPKYNQNFLKRLNDKIQEDKVASKVYPDLLKLMETVLKKISAEEKYVEIIAPKTKERMIVGISKLDVQLVTSFFLTKNPEDSVRLPYLYKQMNEGNFTEIAQMVAALKMYAGEIEGMPILMDAASGISKERWKIIQKESRQALLGATTNFPYPELGFQLGMIDLGESFRKNPRSKIPALFFSGTLDGRTYIESAKEIAKGFHNMSHIIVDGAGHDIFMSSPKVKELIYTFFKGDDRVSSQVLKISVPKFIIHD